MSIGRTIYQLAYEISPILLQGGIAASIPGGVLPIVALTEGANFTAGLLGGEVNIDLSSYFAHFEPMAGSMLVNNEVGRYPFANQTVAANAIITQPLTVSLMMSCPVKGDDGYALRLATLTILTQTIQKHVNLGGLFTVATPAYVYTNCLLRQIRDASAGSGTSQRQYMFQWDFEQPLITETAAEAANSDFISKLTQGVRV